MTDPLEQAEEHLIQSEKAGISYQTPEARAAAKLALAEQFTKQAKQEQIPAAASASEAGSVLNAGGDTLEAIDEKLARLRQGTRTAQSMAAIKELNDEKDAIMTGMDIPITFTRE